MRFFWNKVRPIKAKPFNKKTSKNRLSDVEVLAINNLIEWNFDHDVGLLGGAKVYYKDIELTIIKNVGGSYRILDHYDSYTHFYKIVKNRYHGQDHIFSSWGWRVIKEDHYLLFRIETFSE